MIKAKDFNPELVTLSVPYRLSLRANIAERFCTTACRCRFSCRKCWLAELLTTVMASFYTNVLIPEHSKMHQFVTQLNTALNATPPIAKVTEDGTGKIYQYRLRLTLPGLIQGTENFKDAKVGKQISAIARVEQVTSSGEYDLHLSVVRGH